ncbi:hyccin isoform X1 [Trichogramma pretiosum]|uniref:Hyccin n=1 Tax=Trichogramma kaykai TaxID=54128 RepID=A0ABD2WHY6_9HYME|nr:hyccin isoform X1 [Trichogramma pretiosum]
MVESLINEWLSDCKGISALELSTFANNLDQDEEIVQALYGLFEERSKHSQLLEAACDQLFDFYRSREIKLQRFTLQFIPTLIYIYLNAAAHGDIKNCRTVETLLLGIYNLELVDKNGEPKAVTFRLPSLAMMSIYHEPSSLAPASLTESAVRRFEECNSRFVSWGPLKYVETLNAQNRLKVMTALLFIFNQQLGFFNKSVLEQSCKVASQLVTQGFMNLGHPQRTSYGGTDSSFVPKLLPRIPVNNQFLLEILHTIYFSMYNNCWYAGVQSADDIHHRGCYETYPDVMLVTNAIRNSSSSGPPSQTAEGASGISVSSTSTSSVMKSMITNASFRAKKLPDDIPIQDQQGQTSSQPSAQHPSSAEKAKVEKTASITSSKVEKLTSSIKNLDIKGSKSESGSKSEKSAKTDGSKVDKGAKIEGDSKKEKNVKAEGSKADKNTKTDGSKSEKNSKSEQ